MSANICDYAHINYLVRFAQMYTEAMGHGGSFYYFEGERISLRMEPQRVGQALVDQNFRSINYRYDDELEPYEYRHRPNLPPISIHSVDVLEACRGYVYQACETGDFEDTEAGKIIDMLEYKAVQILIKERREETGRSFWHVANSEKSREFEKELRGITP